MQRDPKTTLANDWELHFAGELRKLGQAVLLCQLRSADAGTRHMGVFTSLDGASLARSLGATINPFGALRSLLGTASGPIQANPWRRCDCHRLFPLAELHWRSGHVRGFSAGFAFGYAHLTFVAAGLFSVNVHGITASMMFPTAGTIEGRWYLIDPPAAGPPTLDAPQDWGQDKSGHA